MWYVNDHFYYLKPQGTFQREDEFKWFSKAEPFKQKAVVFDLDGTLIAKANGRSPAHTETDPQNYVFFAGVQDAIWEYIRRGIQVIVVSNQSGFGEAKAELIQDVWETFERKIFVIVCHKRGDYRKPSPLLMNLIRRHYDVQFYCGDAVGDSMFPPYNWGDADKAFALNSDVEFKEPLEIFPSNMDMVPDEDLVIMMGVPGSGKTTFAKHLESSGFSRFSQDEVKSLVLKKNITAITTILRNGGKVVVDATHPQHQKRQFWMDVASENGKTSLIAWCVRDGRPFNELRERPIIPAVYGRYSNEFQRPTENFVVIS